MARVPFAAALALGSWATLVTASWLDPAHDPLEDYVSWLEAGPYRALWAAGLAGMTAAAGLEARHLARTLPPGPAREATVTFLACAAVLTAGTLVLPSRGVDEPEWRTAVHVGLAVGAYAGILGAAGIVARLRRGQPGPRMAAWAAVVVGALGALGLASAAARFGYGVELRGMAQLALMGAGALWIQAAARIRASGSAG